jgi:essential nuclear protein 1
VDNPRGYAAVPELSCSSNRFDSIPVRSHYFLMPRTIKPSQKSRHDPLLRDIAADDLYAKYGNVSKPGRRKKTKHDEDGNGEVTLSRPDPPSTLFAHSHPISQTILDPKTSKRIFELARDQQDELDPPEAEEDEDVIEDDFTRPRTRDLEQLDDDDDDEGEEEQFQGFSGDEEREFVRRLLCYTFFF